jgi:hypothetical protein
MPSSPRLNPVLALAFLSLAIPAPAADESYADWAVLKNPFESTGGGAS